MRRLAFDCACPQPTVVAVPQTGVFTLHGTVWVTFEAGIIEPRLSTDQAGFYVIGELLPVLDDLVGVAGDDQFFVGGDDEDTHLGVLGGDLFLLDLAVGV